MFYSFWMEWSDKRKSNPEWIVCVDVTVNNWMFVLWIYWFSCILFCNVCHMNGRTIVFGCTAEKLISVGKTKEKTSNWIDSQCICPSLILIKFSVVYWSSMDAITAATTQTAMLMWYYCMCNGPAHWITKYQENRIKINSILCDCISRQHRQQIQFCWPFFHLQKNIGYSNIAQKIQLYWMSIVGRSGQNKQCICILSHEL